MKKIEFANEEIMSDFGKRAVLIMATLFTYIFQHTLIDLCSRTVLEKEKGNFTECLPYANIYYIHYLISFSQQSYTR